jgi:phosphoribosylamine--glycine ligase
MCAAFGYLNSVREKSEMPKGTKLMVIDRSGRGHAIADLFVCTDSTVQVLYVPGCSAIQHERIKSFDDIALSDLETIVALAKRESIDFAFVANTAALDNGYVDAFRAAGIRAIGPDRAASRLESSKAYAKDLCARYEIPVADYRVFTDPDAAKSFVASVRHNVVVKADGLCGGNGSYVCASAIEAVAAVNAIMVDRVHGDAGDKVIIEERLDGIELSFFVLFDGATFLLLPMALDYKRADDGNKGVNGGGMGSISPHPLEGNILKRKLEQEILVPLRACLLGEKVDYKGIIYIGAMLTDGKLRVLEFNVRLGDPEAEVVLPRIRNNFLAVCEALLNGELSEITLSASQQYFCNVVLTQGRTRQIASNGRKKGWYKGWPYGRYGRGYRIDGLANIDKTRCTVFIGEAMIHPEKGLVSDGGRVIHVVGFGPSRDAAIEAAYDNVSRVKFEGARYRLDIGQIYKDTMPLTETQIRSALVGKESQADTAAVSIENINAV